MIFCIIEHFDTIQETLFSSRTHNAFDQILFCRIQCDKTIKGDCEATEPARKAFSFILDPIEELIKGNSLTAFSDVTIFKSFLIAYDGIKYDMLGNMLAEQFLRGNKTLVAKVLDDYDEVITNSHIGQVNLARQVPSAKKVNCVLNHQ